MIEKLIGIVATLLATVLALAGLIIFIIASAILVSI